MSKPAQNVQDWFLNTVSRDKVLLTVYLLKGPKLLGRVKSFDKYSLVLKTTNQEQLIFKHAIATIVSEKLEKFHPFPTAGGHETAEVGEAVEE
jgi:host factor-I protein